MNGLVLSVSLLVLPLTAVQEMPPADSVQGNPAAADQYLPPPPSDMGGRREVRPDSPEIVQLKAKFTVEYLLKPEQRRQIFESYLDSLGTQGMLDVLEARNTFCHNEAHELGRAVFSRFKDFGRAMQECGSRCTSACLHGVLKEAFGTSTFDQVRSQLASICTTGTMADVTKSGNCAHGMGHALMMVTSNEVEKAIDGCAGFGRSALEYYCATGVYMELFDQAAQWSGKSALYPCDTYTRFPAACYRYQGVRMLGQLGGDREKLAELCRSLPEGQRRGCFHGFGFANLLEVSRQPELIATVCPSQPVEEQTMCLEGLVESFGNFQPDKAASSCSHLAGPAAEICRAAAREGTYRLDKPSMPLYLAR